MKIQFSGYFYILLFLVNPYFSFGQKTLQEKSGDVLAAALPTAALATTFIFKNGDKGTVQFAGAMATSLAVTFGLKYLIDKPRPNGERYSFPSGHTSSAFTGAAFLQRRFGWKVGAPAYAVASYVGYTRIQARKHDIYDVVAGAAIGVGSVYLFTKPFKNEKISVSMNPRFDGGYQLRFNASI